jgi:release factor glutamine methyltransferase
MRRWPATPKAEQQAMGQDARGLLVWAAQRLAAAGSPSPRVDAELLLAHVLGVPRTRLRLLDRAPAESADRFAGLVDRRALGVPLQHLTGAAPFRELELAVGPGVFIPRPETELIIELAWRSLSQAEVVVDLGAGSGAIALAVANETSAPRVIAVERSEAALNWLRRNAVSRTEAGDRPIDIVAGDIADPELLAELSGQTDVVLSNPPYVPAVLEHALSTEVGFDPSEAVFAGDDGLALMPALLQTGARLLRPGGFLAIEHDESHREGLLSLVAATGQWREVADHRDLTSRSRFVTAVRR